MDDQYPYTKIGDRVTITTTLPDPRNPGHPLTVNGELTGFALDDEGRLKAMAVQDDVERPEPLVIPASSIIVWRAGEPVRVRRQIVPGLVVPDGLPPGLG